LGGLGGNKRATNRDWGRIGPEIPDPCKRPHGWPRTVLSDFDKKKKLYKGPR